MSDPLGDIVVRGKQGINQTKKNDDPLGDMFDPLSSVSSNEPHEGALAGVLGSLEQTGSNIAGIAKTAVTDPASLIDWTKEGFESGAEGLGFAFKHPLITGKQLIWDGLIKPLVVNPVVLAVGDKTPEERFQLGKETTEAALGWGLGAGAGKLVSVLGKTEELAQAARAISRIKKTDDLLEVVGKLAPSAEEALALNKSAIELSKLRLARNTAAWAVGGFTEEAVSGVAGAKNPEEAFVSGFNQGMLGAVLGLGAGAIGVSLGSRFRDKAKLVSDVAFERATDKIISVLDSKTQALTAADLLEGVPFVNAIARNMGTHIPDSGLELNGLSEAHFDPETAPDNVEWRKNGDKYDVLILSEGAKRTEIAYPVEVNPPALVEAQKIADVPTPVSAEPIGKLNNPVPAPIDQQIEPGSNPGGVYLAKDGTKYYVKFQKTGKSIAEAFSNTIYRMLGLNAPESKLLTNASGEGIGTKFVEGARRLTHDELTTDQARTLARGFVADVLLANYDVLGTRPGEYDNIVIDPDGGLHRVDNGGTFMFRAVSDKVKDVSSIDAQWDGFLDPAVNPQYAEVLGNAGIFKHADMLDILQSSIKDITDLRDKFGGFDKLVEQLFPDTNDIFKSTISHILENRTKQLEDKISALASSSGTPISEAFTPSGIPISGSLKGKKIFDFTHPAQKTVLVDAFDTLFGYRPADPFAEFKILSQNEADMALDYLHSKLGYDVAITGDKAMPGGKFEAAWEALDHSGKSGVIVYTPSSKAPKVSEASNVISVTTASGIIIPKEFQDLKPFDYNAGYGAKDADDLRQLLLTQISASSTIEDKQGLTLQILKHKGTGTEMMVDFINALGVSESEKFKIYERINNHLELHDGYKAFYYQLNDEGNGAAQAGDVMKLVRKARPDEIKTDTDLPAKVIRSIYKHVGDRELSPKNHARFVRDFNAAPDARAKLSVAASWLDEDEVKALAVAGGFNVDKVTAATNRSGYITPHMIEFWKEHGVMPSEIIGFNGTEYEVIRADGKDIVARFLGNDTEVIIPRDQVTRFNELRLGITEFLPAVEGHGPKTIKSAYPVFSQWWEQALQDQALGKEIDVASMPPIPFVRNQSTPRKIEFSPVRQGIWTSFADEFGDNGSYRNSVAGPHNYNYEGGSFGFWGLLKTQNPLVILESTMPSSTGKAIISKLQPDLLINTPKAERVLVSLIGQDAYDKTPVYHRIDYPFWDRLGRELAIKAGYKEVLNIGRFLESSELAILYPESEMIQHQITDVELQNMTMEQADKYMDSYIQRIENNLNEDELALYRKHEADLKSHNKEMASTLASRGLSVRAVDDKLAIMQGDKVLRTVEFKDLRSTLDELGTLSTQDLIPPPPTDTPIKMVSDNDGPEGKIKMKRNLLANLRNFANLSLAKLVPTKDLFITLEDTYGKRFFHDFWLPLQQAKLKYQVAIQPWVDKIHALRPIAELSPERKTLIYHAIQTFSPEELLGDKPSIMARALTDEEKSIGKVLAERTTYADRRKAYEYFKAQRELEKDLAGAKADEVADIQAKFNEAWSNFTGPELVAIDNMAKMRAAGIKRASIYAAFSLADAIEFKTMSRKDFMKHHQFNALEKHGVEEIDKLFKQLGPEMGIEDYRMLGGYVTRMKQYDGAVADGSLLLREKDLTTKERDFIYAMTRTGETVDVITDPVEILQRYLTYGMKVKHLQPAVADATDFLVNAYKGMDEGAAHGVHELASRYLNEIRGFRSPSDALALAGEYDVHKDAFTRMAAKVGINKETTSKWLSTYLRVSELATQGFKPIAGIRDATSTLMYYAARFGFKRTAKMMSMWNKAMEVKEGLRKEGTLPGLNVNLLNLIDGQLSKETFLSKIAETGFKYSGQPAVFLQSHAMVYLEHLSTGNEAVTDYVSGKIGKEKLVKRLSLDTFDNVIQKEFWKKLDEQPAKAVEYLADIAGRDMVGHYGMANHPLFMQSKVGKVVGQHGQWPLWMLQNFGRMLGQGNTKRTIGTAARLALMMAAMDEAGEEAGFNLKSWLLSPHNTVFTGGPLAQTGLWAAMAVGSNYPPTQQFAQFMLGRQIQLDRPQYFLPIPAQAYFILEAWQRASYGQPAHIVFGRMMGLPVDYEQYPRPE